MSDDNWSESDATAPEARDGRPHARVSGRGHRRLPAVDRSPRRHAVCAVRRQRYRNFDATRARVRALEENLFANLLDPEDAPLAEWPRELAEDLREPTVKVSYWEALSRRLERVYFSL